MDGKFKIDYDVVDDAVNELRDLLSECKKAYKKEIPISSKGKGCTHSELISLCNEMRKSCQNMGELINNTILFLGKSSKMFKTSDTTQSNTIK